MSATLAYPLLPDSLNSIESQSIRPAAPITGAGGPGDGRTHEAQPAAAGRRAGRGRDRHVGVADAAGDQGAAAPHAHGRQGAAAAAAAGEQAQVGAGGRGQLFGRRPDGAVWGSTVIILA